MSSDVTIRVNNLSKAYRIGLKEQRHETLVGSLAAFVRAPWSNYQSLRKLGQFDDVYSEDVFWALKDVSFEVKHGEAIGIIGRNGAGKSTLLKILSRITEPTRGCARIYGRVASLLEVGTGFHPELTGRENVYLNGTILGMRKQEVDSKFEEIVEFSGVQKFIDTPVKRYSSGMRVRLAFAVAANLEPEILIIDEVLAVGDAQFQKRCLGKMGEVTGQGRTVLFVSHNMAAVADLCQRAVVLDSGKVTFNGTVSQGISYYVRADALNTITEKAHQSAFGFEGLQVNASVEPKLAPSDPLNISVLLKGMAESNPSVYLIIEDSSGRTIIHSRRSLEDLHRSGIQKSCKLEVSIPPLSISPGIYSVYFKALSSGVSSHTRLVSERLPIEVRGECESLGRSLLSPSLVWKIVE